MGAQSYDYPDRSGAHTLLLILFFKKTIKTAFPQGGAVFLLSNPGIMYSEYQFLTVRGQSCPNEQCTFFDLDSEGNVVIHSQKEKRFRCNHCGVTWVEHVSTLEYGLRKSKVKFYSALEMLDRGLSIRKTAEILNVSPTTIQRWKNRLSTV